ncbi:uncharacterized protein [Montipora capricornis]|uniref:uncharacterized protein n=1 Tax=Montipora capricornis TaxID=246305 RepID=UPI0035F0FB95
MADEEGFDIGRDLPVFLASVLDKTEYIWQNDEGEGAAEAHAEVIDQSIRMLRSIRDCRDIGTSDKEELDSLAEAFAHLLSSLNHHIAIKPVTPETVAENCFAPGKEEKETPGRPRFNIPAEMLEELRELGFSWIKIGEMLGVSRWTIHRRVEEYGLQNMTGFHHLPDEELDEIVRSFISDHGRTTGQGYVGGYLKALGFRIQRKRIRESMARVDLQNTALRRGVVVSRRIYQVPWPNSLCHLDGHHALIRWKIIIHGCIDGFSRRIMFLRCNSNNLAETVLVLFLDAIEHDGNLWPSRIRVDKGVENVLVCDAMVQARGEGRGSFIAGPSTHNQRMERLWRDVFRCVCHFYYYLFYAMESTGILNTDNPIHVFTLHLIFIPRINKALDEFCEAFNHHKVRTQGNWSPYEMWANGMFHADNPLAHGLLDEEPPDMEIYGYDPQGPSPTGSDNHVVIDPVDISNFFTTS